MSELSAVGSSKSEPPIKKSKFSPCRRKVARKKTTSRVSDYTIYDLPPGHFNKNISAAYSYLQGIIGHKNSNV
jgi:hypothetical protein